MTLATDRNDNRIGLDFDTADMKAAGGGDHIAFITDAKSVIVDNHQPVTHRPGKPRKTSEVMSATRGLAAAAAS